MMDKLFSLLGLVKASGKMVTGQDHILKHIRNNQAKLVIVAKDAGPNTKKALRDKCEFYNVKYLEYGDIESLSHAIGKVNRVAVGILDEGFSKGLLAKLSE